MDKPKWNSAEDVHRWCKDFRSWLIALLEQIREAQTDALLPEKIIIDRAISSLHESGCDYPYLIDNEFRRSIRERLQAIAWDIAACEIAEGQHPTPTHERQVIENAAHDFLTCSMISEG